MRRNTLIALLAPLGFLIVAPAIAAKKPATAPLTKLFDTAWVEDLADDPIGATQLGDPRFNDKLPDVSPEAFQRRLKQYYGRIQALAKIDREKLEKADQLNYDLFQRETKLHIEDYQFKPWL